MEFLRPCWKFFSNKFFNFDDLIWLKPRRSKYERFRLKPEVRQQYYRWMYWPLNAIWAWLTHDFSRGTLRINKTYGFSRITMSYIKIMVHVVWGTKNREPVLISEKRKLLFDHIRTNAKTKGIYIDTLGGYTDHVHCLVSLGIKPFPK